MHARGLKFKIVCVNSFSSVVIQLVFLLPTGSATKPSTSVNPPPAAPPVAEEQRDEEGTSPLEAEGSGALKQDECIETSKLTGVEPSTCTNVRDNSMHHTTTPSNNIHTLNIPSSYVHMKT